MENQGILLYIGIALIILLVLWYIWTANNLIAKRIIVLILVLILAWNYLKLLLEAAERYDTEFGSCRKVLYGT